VILPGPITTASGEVIETETLRGQVVLINAWATWCGPCVREMPGFQRVLDDLGDQGFFVLGISADTLAPEAVDAYARDLGVSYPVTVGLQPTLGLLTRQVKGLPTSFLLDREGRVSQKVEGVFHEDALREAVKALLKGSRPEGPFR
jgi:thiol-disulfide isomerase/thioredoxin